MYRQPGAVSKSSKQVPKRAQVSGTHFIQSRRTQPALDMRYPSAGPALLRRGSGNRDPPRETPSKGRERSARPGLQAAARTLNQSPERKGGGEGEPRSEATADQAPPKSLALLSPRPSIRGGGRRLHSPRAHHRSRRARRAAGARPLDAPPLPGPRQQPNPAQITPAESPGGSPRGPLLLHRI
ncbi:hypothetical protein NDU88_005131 [Pleurodeles waltl]|uniref:Uncharacterized protein n=1 Tax=Pleurodeles waltl TaxID=8319 RepID=A0AAV7QF48_PLEWA|nr:hypothetical protein NDU88_005131 [Pleurodeles waltl]